MTRHGEPPRYYDFGPFRVDAARRALLRDGQPVALTAKVFDLLLFLLRCQDRVVTRAELLEALWPDVVVEDGNLSANISVLRKALQSGGASAYIETLPRVGYRFSAQVVKHPGQASPEPAREVAAGQLGDVVATGAQMSSASSKRRLFVGRHHTRALLQEREMECLETVAGHVLCGERRAIVVTGEAGMGKTALVNAFLERLERGAELWVARGQCVEQYGGTEPYLPILEPLGRACRGSAGPQLVEALRQLAPTWLAQLPTPARLPTSSKCHRSRKYQA